ncbi:predicted protein [Nematostella vectensis]|uniref:Hexosyltransferase n=1 Tax=Nematostella vectensis TaxID=45351 RepID=A7S848_NEMVE|nr:predicted protein [Nematostella vectensis]|eukprot:XP_001632190.1 predicted protein [Nematostella vectensis]
MKNSKLLFGFCAAVLITFLVGYMLDINRKQSAGKQIVVTQFVFENDAKLSTGSTETPESISAPTPKLGKDGKPKVDLFMALITAPVRLDRRMANRETWLTTLKNYPNVAMRFFTDAKGWDESIKANITEERKKYGDLEFIPTSNGYWYGHRYMWMLFWAFEHYDFNFFLKTDDDYFVCLNNLANDLQYRKNEKYLYWGWLGCDPSMVAMDSGLLILGKDLASEFVKRNDTLLCHPMAGQMIAMFINKLEAEKYDVTYFADNSRLVHYRSHLKDRLNNKLCSNLIGIHQAYPKHMREYWSFAKDSWYNETFPKVERKPYSEYCSRPKGWDWRVLGSFWKHEPKPCWAPDTDWPELHKYKMHKGREDE